MTNGRPLACGEWATGSGMGSITYWLWGWVTHTSLPMPLFPHLRIYQFLFLTFHSKASKLCLGLAETVLQGQILKSSQLVVFIPILKINHLQ